MANTFEPERHAPIMERQEVIDLMKSSNSEIEWNANCDFVKKLYDGNYPDFWFPAIMLSGVFEKAKENWNTSKPDEVNEISESLAASIRSRLLPVVPNGKVIIVGTPYGHDWLKDIYDKPRVHIVTGFDCAKEDGIDSFVMHRHHPDKIIEFIDPKTSKSLEDFIHLIDYSRDRGKDMMGIPALRPLQVMDLITHVQIKPKNFLKHWKRVQRGKVTPNWKLWAIVKRIYGI